MSATETSPTQTEEEKLVREKVEKKVRKKLQKRKGGISKMSKEDRETVLANKEKTLELVKKVQSDLATYKKLRKDVNRLFAIARANAKDRRFFADRARSTLSELEKLNPGCCPECGLMGNHPKDRYCTDRYCEDNAYRSSDWCFPPLYWGREFSEEEYKQLYCNRVGSSDDEWPPASESDPDEYISEEE